MAYFIWIYKIVHSTCSLPLQPVDCVEITTCPSSSSQPRSGPPRPRAPWWGRPPRCCPAPRSASHHSPASMSLSQLASRGNQYIILYIILVTSYSNDLYVSFRTQVFLAIHAKLISSRSTYLWRNQESFINLNITQTYWLALNFLAGIWILSESNSFNILDNLY